MQMQSLPETSIPLPVLLLNKNRHNTRRYATDVSIEIQVKLKYGPEK